MKAKLIQLFMLTLIMIFMYVSGCKGPSGCRDYKASNNLCDTVSSNVNQDLNGVIFTDPHKGIAVGDSGTVIVTGNGGYKWSAVAQLTTQNLYGVCAASPVIIVAVGANGTIMRSTNGGVNWATSIVNTLQPLRTVAFYTDVSGYAAGDSGVVLLTNDAGVTWTKVRGDPAQSLYGLSYNSHDTLFIVGSGGIILKGSSFASISVTSENLKSIHFALGTTYFNHSDTGFIAGDNGTVIKTTNGGDNWSIDLSNTSENLRSVFLTSSHWGYSVGEDGTVIRYNGRRWTLLPKATTKDLNGVDPNIWQVTSTCVGEDGEILIYNPPEVPHGVGSIEPDVSSDCGSWSFVLNIESLQHTTESGEVINFNVLSASASVSVQIGHMVGTGWVVNDNFHNESGYLTLAHHTYNFSNFNLRTTSSPGPYYITCCLRDADGNPWLLSSFECPYP